MRRPYLSAAPPLADDPDPTRPAAAAGPLARAASAAVAGVVEALTLTSPAAPARNEPTPCTRLHPGVPGCTTSPATTQALHETAASSRAAAGPGPTPAGRAAGAGGRDEAGVRNEATPCTPAHPRAPWRVVRDAAAVVRAHMTLEPRQVMAARLLLSGARTGDVAAALGVTRHAVTRWKKDPRFQAEVRQLALELEVGET